MLERLRGIRDPAPNRREVSIARLVAVGRAVVVGGSKQILPTTTISFYGINTGGIEWVQVMRMQGL